MGNGVHIQAHYNQISFFPSCSWAEQFSKWKLSLCFSLQNSEPNGSHFSLSDLCMVQTTINKIHHATAQCPRVVLQRTALPITNCSLSAHHKLPNTMQSIGEGKGNRESICNFFQNDLNISCQMFYRIMHSWYEDSMSPEGKMQNCSWR